MDEFDASEFKDILGDKGVLKKIIQKGEERGFPIIGNKVYVKYEAKLENGTVFDSNHQQGDNLEISLAKGALIKGLEVGILSMTKNEKAQFYITYDYGYGAQGYLPKIPPSSNLIYTIELLGWKLDDLSPKEDGGILFQLLERGEGRTSPNNNGTVEIHVKGLFENKVFDDRKLFFILGEGAALDIVEGIEIALLKFKKNTKALLKLKSAFAFGQEGKPAWSIPPNATVEYEVKLLRFEKAKEMWDMFSEERLEQAEIFKSKGTGYFKDGNIKLALKQYNKVLEFVDQERDLPADKEVSRKHLLVATNLNLALCYLKQLESYEAVRACERALEFEPANIKALYRRGQARMEMKEYESALDDFEALLAQEPDNKAAKNLINSCRSLNKKQLQKERTLYRNMFDKLTAHDLHLPSRENLPNPDFWLPNEDENAQMEENLELGAALLDETLPTIDRAPA